MITTNKFYEIIAYDTVGETTFDAYYLDAIFAKTIYNGLCKCEDVSEVNLLDATTGEVIFTENR